jgi:hypothetical protein
MLHAILAALLSAVTPWPMPPASRPRPHARARRARHADTDAVSADHPSTPPKAGANRPGAAVTAHAGAWAAEGSAIAR